MDKNLQNQVEDLFKEITKLNKEGSLPNDEYHKCLVCLAYEYALADDISNIISLLSLIPLSYFENIQEKQMKEDKDYTKIVVILATKLVELGLMNFNNVILQKPAQA